MPVQTYTSTWTQEPSVQTANRILVVDDDVTMVQLLKEYLESEGYDVRGAYDGQMALRLARSESFDLITLDINIPMTNGFKVFEYLRANPKTERIPVIFVTAEMSSDVFPTIAQAPRAAHLKKPVDLESLNSLVKHFLDRYPVA